MFEHIDAGFAKLQGKKVLVIGDIILDSNLLSTVERISPEAPVPVAKYTKETFFLGGAANVAANVAALGLDVTLIGGIGSDSYGEQVKTLCKEKQITLNPVMISQTTVKKRIIARGSQLVRLDYEELSPVDFTKISPLLQDIDSYDVILISDYQKGIVTSDVISCLEKLSAYVAADTKPGTFTEFSHFSLVKPNFAEAVGIAQRLGNTAVFENTDADLVKLGTFLRAELKTDLLITRSDKGATFVGDEIIHRRSQAQEVADVTGGGDTCLAIFACLHASGVPIDVCLEIMNAAAHITVSHVGIYAPSIEEITAQIQGGLLFTNWNDARKRIEAMQALGKKVVFTNGCFDILHRGHITYLHEAKQEGDFLVIGLNSDSSVKKLKGPLRPIIDQESRAFVLSHLQSVDMVVLFEEDTPIELLKVLRPDVFVKGGDYTPDKLPEIPVVESWGGTWKILSVIDGHSTTKIVERIQADKNV